MTDDPSAIRVASAPINWGVHEIGPGFPDPDAMLDEMREAGYAGCELGPLGYFGDTAEAVTGRFAPRGLALVSAFVTADLARPLSDADAQRLGTVADFLKAGGCRVMILSDDITRERLAVAARAETAAETWWDDAQWARVPRTIAAVAEIARARGLTLTVHPHLGTHLETPAEIGRLFDLLGDAGAFLCLDTGHTLAGGSDPVALLRRAGSGLAHFHAKDIDGAVLARLRSGELDYHGAVEAGLYADLGTGLVDWDGIKAGLDAAGYAGWVVAEQDRSPTEDLAVAAGSHRRNRAFIKGLLGV